MQTTSSASLAERAGPSSDDVLPSRRAPIWVGLVEVRGVRDLDQVGAIRRDRVEVDLAFVSKLEDDPGSVRREARPLCERPTRQIDRDHMKTGPVGMDEPQDP